MISLNSFPNTDPILDDFQSHFYLTHAKYALTYFITVVFSSRIVRFLSVTKINFGQWVQCAVFYTAVSLTSVLGTHSN